MTSLLSLLRVQIKSYFGLTSMRVKYIRNKQKLWEPILVGFALIMGAASMGGGIYFLARAIIHGAPPGQADMGLTLPILFSQVVALVMGLFTLISIFYFSNDMELLVPLPLRESHILLSKFTIANITEYIPALVIVIPPLVAYNQFLPLGLFGWLTAILVFLLLPIVPLAIAGIFAVTLMRGLNRKHRDLLIVISSLVLLAGILYFQYAFQSAIMNEVDIEAVIQNRVDLVHLLGSFFPPSVWATRAISRVGEIEGLLSLGYLLLSSLGAVWAFMTVGQRVFYGGLVGGDEYERKNVDYTKHVVAKQATATPVMKALFMREWKRFIRVPIWVLNGFIAILIVPLMAFFPALSEGQSLGQLAEWASSAPSGKTAVTLVFAALIAALSALNTLCSTSISREGKHLWISKMLPISAKQQVLSKILHAGLAAIISAIPIIGLYQYVFNPGVLSLVAALLLGLFAGATPQLCGLIFDMWHPFLTWSNPQHAVKNNLNAVFPLILMLPLGFGSFLAYRSLINVLGNNSVLLTLLVVHSILAVVCFVVTLRLAERLYLNLEITS